MCHYEPAVQGMTLNVAIGVDCFITAVYTLQPLSIALASIVVYVRAGGSLGSLGKCLNRIESGWNTYPELKLISYAYTGRIGRSRNEYSSVDGGNEESQQTE